MSSIAAPRTPSGVTYTEALPRDQTAAPDDVCAGGSSGANAAPPLRLLVLAPGSRGDVQPLLAVVRLLVRDGHSVRFVAHEVFRESVEALNEEAFTRGAGEGDSDCASASHATASGLAPRADVAAPVAAVHPRPRGAVRFCAVHGAPLAGQTGGLSGASAEEAWRLQLADYRAAASLGPVDAVLMNWFGIAGVHLAEALHCPAVALWPGAPLTRTRAFACPLLPLQADAPPAGDDAHLRGYITWEAVLWRAAAAPLNAWRRDELGLPSMSDPLGHFAAMARDKVPVLYGFSSRALPPPGDWPGRVLACGAFSLPAPSTWAPPQRLLDFLQRQGGAPVLYCGFGSAALRDGAAVAAACIAGGRAAGCRVLLAGGLGGGLPRPHNDDDADVMWLQDAPHDWLLPRCAVALHHGGAGTVHAALRAGTPQVIAPLQYDQPFWARRMRALGVAPAPLDVAALRSGDVAAAVRRALSEPIRSRAAAIRDELASDADGAAVAAAFIAAYVPAALEKMKRLKAAADAPLQPCSADERAGETAARARTVAAGGCG